MLVLVLMVAGGGLAQEFEVLSHICKYAVHNAFRLAIRMGGRVEL